MKAHFHKFAIAVSRAVGSPYAFGFAMLLIIGWVIAGPVFGFSDTWQLVINTSTTIITFLVVFLIQNTQNNDSRALHIKIDELIRSHKEARNTVIDLETLSDEQLDALEREYKRICKQAQA
jgi:low affinity Fe/Cu permease